MSKFPKDFIWGAAAASYQIEGAAREEGKGPSIWDAFSHTPGKVLNGDTGDVACDHYHRYAEDVGLMKEIGLKAYRFSISWPRVIPSGAGAVNSHGLAFYDRLIDTLLAAKIVPYVTLFHWDYPKALYDRGGWLDPDSSQWFADYTKVIVDRLSDRVTHWMTLNEPQVFVGYGHQDGNHAPGVKLGMTEVLRIAHNVLLAHGKSVQMIRAHAKSTPIIGYAPVGVAKMPVTESKEDIEAARKATFSVDSHNTWNNTWWMDPVFLGHYPEEGLKAYEKHLPKIQDGDLKTIFQPLDFFGTNIYNGQFVKAASGRGFEAVPYKMGQELTAFKWPVTPTCLYWAIKFFHERYKKPIYITENGLSSIDWVCVDGKVHDAMRIDFLTRYIREFSRAYQEGADIRGYFHWSILDNFEWAEGYRERFGLVHVDYVSQKRTPKDSAYWYRDLIRSNGENL